MIRATSPRQCQCQSRQCQSQSRQCQSTSYSSDLEKDLQPMLSCGHHLVRCFTLHRAITFLLLIWTTCQNHHTWIPPPPGQLARVKEFRNKHYTASYFTNYLPKHELRIEDNFFRAVLTFFFFLATKHLCCVLFQLRVVSSATSPQAKIKHQRLQFVGHRDHQLNAQQISFQIGHS